MSLSKTTYFLKNHLKLCIGSGQGCAFPEVSGLQVSIFFDRWPYNHRIVVRDLQRSSCPTACNAEAVNWSLTAPGRPQVSLSFCKYTGSYHGTNLKIKTKYSKCTVGQYLYLNQPNCHRMVHTVLNSPELSPYGMLHQAGVGEGETQTKKQKQGGSWSVKACI